MNSLKTVSIIKLIGMEIIFGAIGISSGYIFYTLFSRPKKFFHKNLPKFQFGFMQISPNIKVNLARNYRIHIHHWITMMVILALSIYIWSDLTRFLFLKTFCLGGIFQGFFYKDRFKIIKNISSDESV